MVVPQQINSQELDDRTGWAQPGHSGISVGNEHSRCICPRFSRVQFTIVVGWRRTRK